ncbi:MAG TPA: ATP-dependent Clp protease ATP-binding subunit [Chitinophaga sp.]|uniref:ATP-dependent Clp protease ATP-binding subunit n=1 Tax=Chitinophaga sp. TaxID=1869181 RepID=UPI002BAAFC5F|nr:ATP-dependent Clp protease ATP-binding subunit [Chitinophaga sp.]HVI44293.1 ATP-dependent Clp protease ATP-binding subunit [Chitinophaga sp.]
MTLSTLTIFGTDLQAVIRIAKAIAKEYLHAHYTPAHLLRACMHKEVGLAPVLHQMNIDVYYLEEWAEVRLDELPRSSRLPDEAEPDDAAATVLQEAINIALENDSTEADAWSLLIALCTPGVGFSYEQLKTFPFTRDQLIAASKKGKSSAAVNSGNNNGGGVAAKPVALKYVYRITDPQLLQTFHPVIGRDGEIRAITEILTRKDRASVLIIGEGGVGKTALAEGLAKAIVEKQVPLQLQSSDIYALDYGAFIAGAAYKNELEDRLLQIIQQLKQSGRHILFIDNLHTLLDKQSGGGMANVLKAALGKGEIILIGSTTPEGFRKLIEPDAILRHRFETITLPEPDETQATRMITAVVPVYESFYKLKVLPESIYDAIRLSKRYLKERSLPDSAVNLLDRTMAAVRAMQDTGQGLLQSLRDEFAALTAKDNLKADDLQWFYRQMTERLGALLASKLHTDKDVQKISDVNELTTYLQQLLEQLATAVAAKHEEVTPVDLATMIAGITGIPLGKIQSQERERLVSMDLHLQKRVVGQDHALKAVADAILESRSGLSRPGQPIGSFFFLGPTGTGKTELAKSLADFLFQDERSMIRFDMSEFKEEHAAALLYGAPPGYVGYEEGGLLVNKIRQQPYAVVLFDEIEKAHPSVFDIFLQIMDEGKLHDRLGKTGDFSNALVLFTSNIGSDTIAKSFQQGVIPPSQQLMELMARHFRPEFLGRLTEIVPFGPIQQENVEKIFDIHLRHLLQLLEQQQINLNVTPAARKHLAMLGYSPQYGARPLREVIRGQLRKPLSRMIIDGSLQKDMSVTLDLVDEKLDWKIS